MILMRMYTNASSKARVSMRMKLRYDDDGEKDDGNDDGFCDANGDSSDCGGQDTGCAGKIVSIELLLAMMVVPATATMMAITFPIRTADFAVGVLRVDSGCRCDYIATMMISAMEMSNDAGIVD